MNIDDVKKIAVIGAGNMGHQISLLCAIHGYTTTCTDINEDILKKAEAFTDAYLPGRVKKGRLTEEQAQAARDRITFTASMEAAVQDADYVIEAVIVTAQALPPTHTIASLAAELFSNWNIGQNSDGRGILLIFAETTWLISKPLKA